MDDTLLENLSDLISTSLLMVAKGHMWHFTSKRFVEHRAYEDFYLGLQNLVDKLAETALGISDDIMSKVEPNLTVNFTTANTAREQITDFVDFIGENYDELAEGEYTPLTNILDEITGLCLRTLYLTKLV